MNEPLATLHHALAQIEAQPRTINLFFRDDDVDEDEDSLHRLLEVFLHHDVPINLAVIPGLLSDSAIDLLRGLWSDLPERFDLNQHGWRHINHEREGRKCEFGPSRNFEEQLADIKRGKQVLEAAFGDGFSPVFVPPWNRCTADTLRALDHLGFQALSQIRNPQSAIHNPQSITGHSFRELPVTLDLYNWKGGVRMKKAPELIDELVLQLLNLDTVGVMLHHKVMDDAAFYLLASLLGELRNSRVIRFHTFRSMLNS